MVSPVAPRPVATNSPATPGTGPSSGRAATGRKPTLVSRYVPAPRPGASASASPSTSARPAGVTR